MTGKKLHTSEDKMLHKICISNSKLHHCLSKFSISHTHTHQFDNYSGKTLTHRAVHEVHENGFRVFKVLAETDIIFICLLINQGQLTIHKERQTVNLLQQRTR